jgi:2'-5' RNA ligase
MLMETTPSSMVPSQLPPLRHPNQKLGEFRPKTKRLFFGLELPAAIRSALATLRPTIRQTRPVAEEQLHLTLSFLGDIPTERCAVLQDAANQVKVGSFFLPVQGIGTFGGHRPKVLWAGVGNGHPHLFALHKKLTDGLLNSGFSADLQAFHPHITLARMDDSSAEMWRPFLREHAEDDFGICAVKEFVLFSSQRTPAGSTYHVEHRFPLA